MRLWPVIVRRVHGHSMVPVLPPGTLVWGRTWFWGLKPEDVVVFRRGDKEMLKRVERVDGDELFVVGDHVEASTDSRHFGTISKATVIAKVIYPRTRRTEA
jgi:phage repressor protein C with HTH and peptisase S24 domain